MPEFDSKELEEFVKSVLDGIRKGCGGDYHVSSDIEFELAVVNVKRGEGGIRLFVVDAKGGVSNEMVSKIKFTVSENPSEQEPSGFKIWDDKEQ